LRFPILALLVALFFVFAGCGSGDSTAVDDDSVSRGPLVWTQQVSLDDSALNDVFIVDERIAWAVGSDGVIIATKDGVILATGAGGATWTKQRPPSDVAPTDVWLVDQDRGWVVGCHGTLATKDGGDAWIQQKTKTPPAMHAVDFVDARHGWAVGSTGPYSSWSDACISATDDGGRSWRREFWAAGLWLTDVSFTDARLGCAVGFRMAARTRPRLLRTVDGGRTLDSMPLSVERGRFHGAQMRLEAVQFLDAEKGWIAAEAGMDDADLSPANLIPATADGGATWSVEFAGERDSVSSLFMLDSEHGWGTGVFDPDSLSGAGGGIVLSAVGTD